MDKSTPGKAKSPGPAIDMDKFRLRSFVETLIGLDEVEIHDGSVPLIGLGAHLNGNTKAVLFRQAGPENAEIVGNVLGAPKCKRCVGIVLPATDGALVLLHASVCIVAAVGATTKS